MPAWEIKNQKRARALLCLSSLFGILCWQCSQLAYAERQTTERQMSLSSDHHFRLMLRELEEERVLFKDFTRPRTVSGTALSNLESRLREYAQDDLYIRVAIIGERWVSRAEEFANEAAKKLNLREGEALIIAHSKGLQIRSGGLLEKDEQRLEVLATRELDKGIAEVVQKAAELLHQRRLAQRTANRLGAISLGLFFGGVGVLVLLIIVLGARSRRKRQIRLHQRATGLLAQVAERASKLINSEEAGQNPEAMRLVRQAGQKQARAETIIRLSAEAVDEAQLEAAIGLLSASLAGLQAAENLCQAEQN